MDNQNQPRCDKCSKTATVIYIGLTLCPRHASEQFRIEQNLEEKRHREEIAKIANEYRRALEKGLSHE